MSSGPLADLDVEATERAIGSAARPDGGSGGAVLIDVREPDEFRAERIPGAINVPLSAFNPAVVLDEHGDGDGGGLILHCKMGGRSAQAAGLLLRAGATRAAHLAGGIEAWKAAGRAVDTG